MLKAVYITNDRRKIDDLANLITSGLNDFKNEIENMNEEEKEIDKPNQIVDIAKKFLAFNAQQITNFFSPVKSGK